MRSTLQIIIAVKENQPVEHEELRLALLVMSAVDHFKSNALNDLIESVNERPKIAELRAGFAKVTVESMFQAIKKEPAEWLGRENIPGNPEHDERYRDALALGKKLGVI